MDEVDKIIIDSLKQLNCNFDEHIDSLKQFDADTIVNSLSTCLETINPALSFPKKLSHSMSAKLELTSALAQEIKNLGFRGDMGYQTILYCNEIEIRRVLMFLIERLPKETNHLSQIDQTGYVPKIIKKIEDNLKKSIGQLWLPSSVLNKGVREFEFGYTVSSFGTSTPPITVDLEIPDSRCNDNDLRQYWVHHVPEVTQQCSPKKLIQSLLYHDTEYPTDTSLSGNIIQRSTDIDTQINLTQNIQDEISTMSLDKVKTATKNDELYTIDVLLDEFERHKNKYIEIQKLISESESELSLMTKTKDEEQKLLQDLVATVTLKTKTLAVASKEENKNELKNLIRIANEQLIDLSNQWNEVQTPLLEEYNSLKNTLSSEQLKYREEQIKLNNLKDTYSSLLEDIKQKYILKQHLIEQCQTLNKGNKRAAFTQKILEIVGNIKKQNIEIQKILQDTKDVQKDINTLTGQVDRSFTLADEMIFQDAKQDEMARIAYKLLVALRDEFGQILKAVTDIGHAEREFRNIEEQVEAEKNKKVKVKLERVFVDLEQIRKEILELSQNKQ